MYEKFQLLLDKTNKTPYQVSKDTGISTATLSNWKNGAYNLDVIEGMSLAIGYIVGSPTAYYMDKVVEQLNELLEEKTSDSGEDWYTAECLSEAIEIVKRGGRNEK